MINWSSKHIALIAIFFSTAFVGMLTTIVFCDLKVIEYAPKLAHHSAETGDSHDESSHSHHHSESSDGKSHGEDSCCEEVTSQFEASLFTKVIKNQKVDVKFFLLEDVVLLGKFISLYQVIYSLYHEYDDPPPLSGYGIRVLLQSFLN